MRVVSVRVGGMLYRERPGGGYPGRREREKELMTYRLVVDVPHQLSRWLRRGGRAVHADDVAQLVFLLAPANCRPSLRQH